MAASRNLRIMISTCVALVHVRGIALLQLGSSCALRSGRAPSACLLARAIRQYTDTERYRQLRTVCEYDHVSYDTRHRGHLAILVTRRPPTASTLY